MATIQRFEVWTTPHPSCGNSYIDQGYPATQAGLALALDRQEYESINNKGAYGNIGCGTCRVYAVVMTDEGQALIPYQDVPTKDLPVGSIKLSDWLPMQDTVWDGNNHIPFTPTWSRHLWSQLQFHKMKYHIFGEHPELGCILTGYWFSLAVCRRNHQRLTEQAGPGWAYRIVLCLTPYGACSCEPDDTFKDAPGG